MSSTSFKKVVWAHYRKSGRHNLPWRKTRDPYRILVSEIMLQQTQVDRVIPKYRSFLKKFPTLHSLAKASLADVLREWQGLGYNRRAKFLHETAKAVVATHKGTLPRVYEQLVELPGIGEYTAKAVRTFAWNEPEIFIETNIRTAFIHYFFPNREHVSDSELVGLLADALPQGKSREWYFALMDYGAHIKKTEGNASRRSAHHTKQKPFKGSEREVRGAILRALSQGPATIAGLRKLPFSKERIQKQLTALLKEGLIEKRAVRYQLPN